MNAKKVLVTAGKTLAMIDKVRGIGNPFRGRTGLAIANYLASLGHEVTLLTSSSDVERGNLAGLLRFRTFDDLLGSMKEQIVPGEFDVVIHSAAVNDYKVNAVYQALETTDLGGGRVQVVMQQIDNSGKISSEYDALYPQLEPTPKIVDLIREPWGFTGKLVKFKLQEGINDEELLEIARHSRVVSHADLMVANCLEWMYERAFILGEDKEEMVTREDLPRALARRLEL